MSQKNCRLVIVPSLLLLSLQLSCGREGKKLEENQVIEILDGDTIKLINGIVVRYIGIDAPEEGEPFYTEAKRANANLVEGRGVRLEFDLEARDKYDRMLAYVYVDTLMVNLALVRGGLARIYPHPPNLRHLQKLCSAQKLARDSALGIWGLSPPKEESCYLALKDSYRFHGPDCPAVRNKPPEELRVYGFKEEALDDCLSPCRRCKP